MFQLHGRVIYFPILSKKGYKKPHELQDPKYTPQLSVAEIRISLLFEENALFCSGKINLLL